jgi:hypothetical protein
MRLLGLVLLMVVVFSFAPAGAAIDSDIDWGKLRRPLHLPRIAHGHRCPISRLAPGITAEKFGVSGAIGRGPVYPILPAATLSVSYRREEWGPGPWGGQKVLWLVHPRYRGPVLIRGRRLDGLQSMRFDRGVLPAAEIRIKPGETVTWMGQAPASRGRPSYVRIRAAGCYGAQIDGTAFSAVVVFVVSGPG